MTRSNTNFIPPSSANWPDTASNPEELLRQAEHHLSQAIVDSRDDPRGEEVSSNDPVSNVDAPVFRSPTSSRGLTLEDLGDLELDITIELGRSELLIEDVLKLREGSVVSLDKRTGDPVDIIANGRLIGRGELLVVDGKFGVRLSEIL